MDFGFFWIPSPPCLLGLPQFPALLWEYEARWFFVSAS